MLTSSPQGWVAGLPWARPRGLPWVRLWVFWIGLSEIHPLLGSLGMVSFLLFKDLVLKSPPLGHISKYLTILENGACMVNRGHCLCEQEWDVVCFEERIGAGVGRVFGILVAALG